MHFRTPALTPQHRLDRLVGRDLQVRDANPALRLLEVTSYFRLIPYMRPFESFSADGRCFRPGTGLDQIWALYQIDSQGLDLTQRKNKP